MEPLTLVNFLKNDNNNNTPTVPQLTDFKMHWSAVAKKFCIFGAFNVGVDCLPFVTFLEVSLISSARRQWRPERQRRQSSDPGQATTTNQLHTTTTAATMAQLTAKLPEPTFKLPRLPRLTQPTQAKMAAAQIRACSRSTSLPLRPHHLRQISKMPISFK